METLYKTFRPEVKGVNLETGEIDMLIPMSTASVDRDGESIDPIGWRKSLPAFRKRPVLLSSHNYGDLRKQIGEFSKIKVSEDGLFASPRYYINEGNEEADWAFKLASKGMAAYSVGFIPKQWTDGDGDKTPARTYTEQELLEISHVVVPSNRDAIQGLRGKSADPMINQIVEDLVNSDIVDNTDHALEIESSVIHKAKEHSQQEMADEIDYLESLINVGSFALPTMEKSVQLALKILDIWERSDLGYTFTDENLDLIKRLTGDDMPEQIKSNDDDKLMAIINQTVTHVINHI